MALQDDGKQVMLEELGTAAVRCDLYDGDGSLLTGEDYNGPQTVSWTFNGTTKVLELDDSDGICAEFEVPAGTVKYIGFRNSGLTATYIKHDLGSDAETFTNPGIYQVTAGSVELDPA